MARRLLYDELMRRLITYTLLALTLMGGVAIADRDRDRRSDRRDRRDDRHDRARDHRVHRHNPNRRAVVRNRVYVNNGNYRFHNGVTRVYRRPVISHRYYNYRVRPQIIVENYDPVPGYVWINGTWSWNGREWYWNNGHYAPDTRYKVYYDDGSYD